MPLSTETRRVVLISLGSVLVALGAIGALLPLLPTTPFLLLAAACFAKSSVRCHQWLLHNPVFGPTIATWERHRALPVGVKPRALLLLWIVLGVSMVFAVDAFWQRALLAGIGAAVSVFLLSLPEREAEPVLGTLAESGPPPS